MSQSRPVAVILIVALSAIASACAAPQGGGNTPPLPAPSKCGLVAPGSVRVAVVVDASDLPGGSLGSQVTCVVIPAGSTGVAVLAARAAKLGRPAPRYDNSGLLCSIDGLPIAPDCGTLGPTGYRYWSYWLGGGSWTFSPVGPASRAATDGMVDGWRFANGGTVTAPSGASQFAALVS